MHKFLDKNPSAKTKVGIIGTLEPYRDPISVNVIRPGKIIQPVRELRLLSSGVITIADRFSFDAAVIMWDTGATESVVFLPDVRSRVGQEPEDHGMIWTATRSLDEVLYYPGRIELFNKIIVELSWIDVVDARSSFADAIIGMDIISKGKLVVNRDEFSFEI